MSAHYGGPEYITSTQWDGQTHSIGDLVTYQIGGDTATGVIFGFKETDPRSDSTCNKAALLLTNNDTGISRHPDVMYIDNLPKESKRVDAKFFVPELDAKHVLFKYDFITSVLEKYGLTLGIQVVIRAKAGVEPSLHLAWSEEVPEGTRRRIDLRVGLNDELPPSVFVDFQPFETTQDDVFLDAKNEIPNLGRVIDWLIASPQEFYGYPFVGVNPNRLDDTDGDPFDHSNKAKADPNTQAVLKVLAKLQRLNI